MSYVKIKMLVDKYTELRKGNYALHVISDYFKRYTLRKNEEYMVYDTQRSFPQTQYVIFDLVNGGICEAEYRKDDILRLWCEKYSGDSRSFCHGTFEHYEEDELEEFDGELYCEEWLADNTGCCYHDGERYRIEDLVEFNGELYSQHWIENHTFTCGYCNELTHQDEERAVYNHRGHCSSWCEHCTENNAYYWESDSDYHTEPEPDEDQLDLHDYGYKPAPRFMGENGPYIGLEIEMEHVTDIQKTKEFWYVKYDGSLDENGAELVTHPFSYEYWKETGRAILKRELDKLANNGARSWTQSNCGLHIHVSKNAWNSKLHVAKTVEFLRRNEGLTLLLSRRKDRRALYAYSGLDFGTGSAEIAKTGFQNDRYCALNMRNRATNEFRIFKGTMNIESIDAYIETVRSIIAYTNTSSWLDLTDGGYLAFVKMNRKQYKNLFNFLVEKGKLTALKAKKLQVA